MEQDETIQPFHMVELIPKGMKNSQDEEDDKHDCTGLQREAFERGHLKGWEEGVNEGRAQCEDHVNEELSKITRMANEIGRARLLALQENEQDIMEIALAIARNILLRELEVDSQVAVRQVRHVLSLLRHKGLVLLKVHPQDFEQLDSIRQSLSEEFLDGDHVVLEADEEIDRGGCRVEQAGLRLEVDLLGQLETVAQEFGIESSTL